MCEDIITNDKICRAIPGNHILCITGIKKRNIGWDTLCDGNLCRIFCRFHTFHRNMMLFKILEKISVVAGNLHHKRIFVISEPASPSSQHMLCSALTNSKSRMKNTHSPMKRSVPVPQTHPVEPANNADSNKSQEDNTVPSHEWIFLRDTCLTRENFPDLKMALGRGVLQDRQNSIFHTFF